MFKNYYWLISTVLALEKHQILKHPELLAMSVLLCITHTAFTRKTKASKVSQ